jgi:hypothetical protein
MDITITKSRCFIIGNGPSLKDEKHLSELNNEDVFIVNRGYFSRDLGLHNFKYYAICDRGVAKGFYNEINKEIHNIEYRFICTTLTDVDIDFPDHKNIVYQRNEGMLSTIPESINDGWGNSKNVINDALIISYFLGYKEIYLLGSDWTWKKNANGHFYKDARQETSMMNRQAGPKSSIEDIKKSASVAVKFIESKGVVVRNLSPVFPYPNIITKDTLENVLGI